MSESNITIRVGLAGREAKYLGMAEVFDVIKIEGPDWVIEVRPVLEPGAPGKVTVRSFPSSLILHPQVSNLVMIDTEGGN